MRQQWERAEKEDIRKALTFLVKLEYGKSEPNEVLQIVAELAERGIRHIRDKVFESGEYNFLEIVEKLRKETSKRGQIE